MFYISFNFTWNWWNGSAWTAFSAGNLIGFYGSTTYGTRVRVGTYNQGMHLRTSSGTNTDACPSPHLVGLQYLTSSTVSINGGGSVNLNTVTQHQSIQIDFTDGVTSISTENTVFWAYDGTVTTNPPSNVTPQAAENGASAWINAGGSGAAAPLANQNAAIDHDWYVMMSATPTAIGVQTNFAWEIQVDYY